MADNASEQTLQELLVATQQMNASLQKLSSVLGKATPSAAAASPAAGAAKGATDGLAAGMSKFLPMLGPAGKALSVLVTAVEVVSKIFNMLGGVMSGLVNAVGNMAGILGEFAMAATSGTMKLSNMVDVMGDLAKEIPIIGGLLGSLAGPMKYVIQRQEESLEMFKKLSTVGAGVGESLEGMRANARATGLTMDEYATTVSANGAVFATMGGDVQSGVKMFNKNMQAVMGPGSEVSKAFFGMGMTAQDAAGALTNYMRSQGSMNKQSLMDSKAVAQSALEAAQQTQYLAESTGKRKDQIEAEIKQAQEEENWQAYLAGLSEKGAKEATENLKYALAHGGKDAGDMVKTGMMTGVVMPLTESQRKADALTGGALTKFSKGVIGATGTYEERMQKMDKSNAEFAEGTRGAVEKFRTVNGLLMGQGEKALINGTIVANSTRALENGKLKSTEQQIKEGIEQRKKITDSANGDAAALGQQTQNLRLFGNIIDSILGTLSGPFLKPIMALTESFQGVAMRAAEWIKPKMEEFAAWLKPWTDRFVALAKKGTWDEFKTTLLAFWTDIKAKAGPMIKDVWESTKPILFEAIKSLFNFLWDAIKESIIPRWMRGDTDNEKAEDRKKEIEKLKKSLDEDEKRLAAAKERGARGSAQNERAIEAKKKRLAELENEGKTPTTPGGSSTPAAEKAGSKPAAAPPVDQATNIRNWAYSLMTGQAKEGDVPASIKAQVADVQSNPDDSLKKSVSDYEASVKQKAAEDKAKLEKAAADEKAAKEKPAAAAAPTPAAAAPKTQEPSADAATALNTQIAQLVKASRDTADNTKRAADLIASRGNRFPS
jgi:hypothetical protein